MSDRFMTVAKVGEIPEGGVKVVRVDDDPVAVFHVGGRYYALADLCTHDGGELSDGVIDGHVIECERHGARFDIRTGAVLAMPATGALMGTPASISARVAPHTEAWELEPFDSRMSLTTRTV